MRDKGSILVIDDEVNAATALEALLREDGYEVQKANERITEHVANHQSGVYKPAPGEFLLTGKVKLQP